MILGTLGASLLGNLLTGKGILRAGTGKGIVWAGTGRPSSSTSNNHSLNKKNGIFNTAPSFNKLWNTKVLWKWTKI